MKLLTILLSLFSDKAADKISDRLKGSVSPLGPYLRRISAGVMLILLSGLAWFACLFFLLISLFVSLSNLPQFLVPALITSGVCFLIGLLMVIFGFNLARRTH